MSVRRRLFLFVFVPVALLYSVFGILGIQQTRSRLIADLDADLVSSTPAAANLLGTLANNEIEDLFTSTEDPRGFTALVDVETRSVDVFSSNTNPGENLPPSVQSLAPAALVSGLDSPFDVKSRDGENTYRAIATRVDGGRIIVVGESLDRINRLTKKFIAGTLFNTVFIIAAMAGVVYVAVRSGLRPLKRFTEATARVADGDLSERIDSHQNDPGFAEIARATNHMLDRVQQSYEQQRDGREQLNSLLADAAHELRTPLTAMRGTVDLHKMGALNTPESLEAAFCGMGDHTARMANIVEDLIVIARAESVRTDPSEQTPTADLARLAEPAAQRFGTAHPDYPVSVSISPGTHNIAADAALIGVAIDRILSNAATHAPPGTSVQLGLSNDGDTTILSLTDAGPGVPPEINGRVFDRFVRGDTSRARTTGGAGLGLTVAKAIIESAGGTIELIDASEPGARIQLTFGNLQGSCQPTARFPNSNS